MLVAVGIAGTEEGVGERGVLVGQGVSVGASEVSSMGVEVSVGAGWVRVASAGKMATVGLRVDTGVVVTGGLKKDQIKPLNANARAARMMSTKIITLMI